MFEVSRLQVSVLTETTVLWQRVQTEQLSKFCYGSCGALKHV